MASDGREGGYIKLFRSVESSEDFIGMRPDQCWVAVRIVQLANYKPGFSRFRGQAVPVGRGELAHTLETIASRTGATVKVVRTTVTRLLKTGFLGSRTGTVAGTPYRILIVRNYEAFQGSDDEAGTAEGTVAGSDRAATGHEAGSDRALRERREEGEEGKKQQRAEPTSSIRPLGIHLQMQCPKLADLLRRAADAGLGVNPGRLAAPWGEAEALIEQLGPEAALAAWTSAASRRQQGQDGIPLNYLLHPLRDAAKRGPRKQGRGPVAIPTDWSKSLEDIG